MSNPSTTLLDAFKATTTSGNTDSLLVNALSSLISKTYDSVTVTYPSGTQEVYITRTGGIAGTVVQTITINYTDSTKASLLNVAVV